MDSLHRLDRHQLTVGHFNSKVWVLDQEGSRHCLSSFHKDHVIGRNFNKGTTREGQAEEGCFGCGVVVTKAVDLLVFVVGG